MRRRLQTCKQQQKRILLSRPFTLRSPRLIVHSVRRSKHSLKCRFSVGWMQAPERQRRNRLRKSSRTNKVLIDLCRFCFGAILLPFGLLCGQTPARPQAEVDLAEARSLLDLGKLGDAEHVTRRYLEIHKNSAD